MASAETFQGVEELSEELAALRREFHRIPEVGFQEFKTAALVESKLRRLGLEPTTGVAGTGVVALIEGERPGKTLLLRADIDGLPLEERTELPFRSEHPNAMHACGHDSHIAMLLGAAKVLLSRRSELAGNVKLVFQPAEEGPGGAEPMIQAGVLKDPTVDAAIGCHIWNNLPVGQVGVREGPVMASSDEIEIEILGHGGHGAMPHDTADPIVAAGQLLNALQTIVSRSVSPLDPAVVTIATVHGGYKHNIIPDKVRLTGTVRTFSEELRRGMPSHLERVVQGVCAATGTRGTLQYNAKYPPTVNDPGMTALVREAAVAALGEDAVVHPEQSMGGEDMSFFLREVPGCYFFVGSRNPAKGCVHPHHSAEFNLDEDALPLGVKVLVASTLRYLGQS
jgi:amidohydrolase